MSTVSWLQFLGGLGLGLSLSYIMSQFQQKVSEKEEENDNIDDSDEWEDETDSDGEEEKSSAFGPTKMVMAVRMDLKMGKGKIAAQCCHAAVAAFKKGKSRSPKLVKAWEEDGSRKIAVKAKDEDELLTVFAIAKSLGLITAIIQDAGRTQIEAGSKTVVAIGPGPEEQIDQVTRHLGLL